jgi:hypothetical protein
VTLPGRTAQRIDTAIIGPAQFGSCCCISRTFCRPQSAAVRTCSLARRRSSCRSRTVRGIEGRSRHSPAGHVSPARRARHSGPRAGHRDRRHRQIGR